MGEYDATILATARIKPFIIASKEDADQIKELLEDKKLMLLPY